MTIAEELAAFRAGFPGCLVVAFADLSTGMVLASNTAEKTTQEKLDALCEAAYACLLGSEADRLAQSFGAATAPRLAWQADRSGLRCYFKAPAPAEEALCCVVTPDAPLAALSESAAALLCRIASEG